MPQMNRVIEGCAYNPEVYILAFRFKDIGVVIERNKILISKVEDETEALMVINWLKNILTTTNEPVRKQEVK